MTGRDRRALIFGACVVGIAWAGLRGVPNTVASVQHLRTSVEQRARLLTRARARLALLPALTDSIDGLATIADSLPVMLLAAADTTTAQVDMMTRVRATLDTCPVRITGFDQSRATDSAGPLAMASVVVLLESDSHGLLEAIRQLEDNPALAVDSVEVAARDPDGDPSAMEYLATRIAVSGWFSRRTAETVAEVQE